MRKRFYHERACCCTPSEGVTYISMRLLRDMVNREIHPMRCAARCGTIVLKGLSLATLCQSSRHLTLARRILRFTIHLIHDKDYNDWAYEFLNPKYVRLQDVISNGICEIIGRRLDDLDRACGLGDATGPDSWEFWAGDGFYDYLWYEKYDYDKQAVAQEIAREQEEAIAAMMTEQIFRDGQGDLPPQAQDFFCYWDPENPIA